ncbi:MAG: hypothetical protein GX410_01570 [Elusimicrobia bacterium]|nr:hypothetical protein [Elusimicrobiota bacterium]
MTTLTGTLPDGLDFSGQVHRDYKLRQLTLGEMAEVEEDETVRGNDLRRAAAILSRSLVSLGDIPKDSITPALLLGLSEVDAEELISARGRLARRGAPAGKEK